MAGEYKVANHVMLRAPRPRFTVDVEHGESMIPPTSQPIVPVSLPADLGQYAVRTHTSPANGKTTDKEIQTEAKTISTDSTTTMVDDGTDVVPVVAMAKDTGKSDVDKTTSNGTDDGVSTI